MLWAIDFIKKQDISSSSSREHFCHGKVAALVGAECDVDAKIQECVNKLKASLRDAYYWVREATCDPFTVTNLDNHAVEVALPCTHKNTPDRYEFIARPLTGKDEYQMSYRFPVDDIKQSLVFLGFQADITALGRKTVEAKVLWPLLFLQFKESPDVEWREAIQKKLDKLKNTVEVWASELSFYCKYGGMDDDDYYCGLSLDVATANRKLIAATKNDRGDMSDEVDEGSEVKPAHMQLFPGGGEYVLTATTVRLSDTDGVMGIVRNLKKSPAKELVSLLNASGFATELAAVPRQLQTTANLSRPVVRLVKGDNESVRRILLQLASEGAPPSKKRKVVDIINDTEVPTAKIKKVMKKFNATQEQAIKWLRQFDNNEDDAMFAMSMKLYQEGYIEDI